MSDASYSPAQMRRRSGVPTLIIIGADTFGALPSMSGARGACV
jgi:hypothetical protein